MAQEFVVPLALFDDGLLVPPNLAVKGVSYSCPSCRSTLTFRRGQIRRPHFAHRPVADAECSPAAVERATAKYRILAAVRNWRAGTEPRPSIARPCRGCGVTVHTGLKDHITAAVADHRVGREVVDVALLAGERVVALIDLRRPLSHLGSLPWLQLRPRQVTERPAWLPVLSGGLQPMKCAACAAPRPCRPAPRRERVTKILPSLRDPGPRPADGQMARRQEERRKRRLRFFARRQGLTIPLVDYQEYLAQCGSCRRWVLFFRPLLRSTGMPRSAPPPPPARTARVEPDRWANACPYCGERDAVSYLELRRGAYP